MKECNFCVNKSNCATCTDKRGWRGTEFIPVEEVRKYFERVYLSVGRTDFMYRFNNTNPNLVNTHYIYIDGHYYCPYCGEQMYCIQEKESFVTIGHCCICEGARAEVEYEIEKRELERKHEKEMLELQSKYGDKLSFDTDKLLEIKQKIERKNVEDFYCNHFYTINGKKITDINQIIR